MKKFITWTSLIAILIVGILAAADMAAMPRTYDGQNAAVSVYELQQDPESYDDSVADGAAAVIVQQNLAKTHAVNDVTSIVFDFRGYDTMGEAFIMISAVAGVTVLLRKTEAEKKEDRENAGNNKKLIIERVIQRSGCDGIIPFCIVYIFYIILHGHLSPGGGFQGGILMVAVVLLVYLGHGYQNTKKALSPQLARLLEGLALIIYVVVAFVGIVFGTAFCQNVFYYNGDIGALISSGTISWMDESVAFNVLTGSIVLSIGMLSVLFPQDVDSRS